MKKVCVTCDEFKEHEAFGLCQSCYNREYGKKYAEKNKEKLKAKRQKYYLKNREHIKQRATRYAKDNKEIVNKSHYNWRQRNPEKARQYQANYRERHRTAINDRYINKFLKNPRNKLNHAMRGAVNHSLRSNKNGHHWEELVEYNIVDLMKHFKSLFQEGMTLENHGNWHIDHIIPVSSFNFKSYKDKEFKQCWALENLQPLWATDNLRKNKYYSPNIALS